MHYRQSSIIAISNWLNYTAPIDIVEVALSKMEQSLLSEFIGIISALSDISIMPTPKN